MFSFIFFFNFWFQNKFILKVSYLYKISLKVFLCDDDDNSDNNDNIFIVVSMTIVMIDMSMVVIIMIMVKVMMVTTKNVVIIKCRKYMLFFKIKN